MKLEFRIEWGYQMLYSRRHYHPVYVWDGTLHCDRADRLDLWMLEYPVCWWGPCHSARETPLAGTAWRSHTRRRLAGIRVRAKCAEDAVFRLETQAGRFEFSANQVLDDGRISFPVGPRYAFCAVTVCREGFPWFRPEPGPGQTVFSAEDLPLPVAENQRMRMAVLAPGGRLELDVKLPRRRPAGGAEMFSECLCHLQAMPLRAGLPDGENHVAAEIPMTWSVDGTTIARQQQYFRPHDGTVQMLEDVWMRFPLEAGRYRIGLENGHAELPLHISRLVFEPKRTRHLQMTLPRWALCGQPFRGRIFAVRPVRATLACSGTSREVDLCPGWNAFAFVPHSPEVNLPVAVRSEGREETAVVDAVYDLSDECPEAMVGFDMTVVPHDGNGFMDWLLDYTARTQLGNTVVFRSFRPDRPTFLPPDDALLARWGDACREDRIHVQSVNCHAGGVLREHAGAYMHNGGRHEYPGVVYAMDPPCAGGDAGLFAAHVVGADRGALRESSDMKDAHERYIAFLREDVEATRATGVRPAYGNASGAHRHCYLAGASFIRTETMVPHTQHVCSQARAAAESLGNGDWGVHIAIQHAVQPYDPEGHLGQYFLSLFQPWMMGANAIYEEDSLFLMCKEERQGWDDALTRGKRDMTRAFFRFVKTHPRRGAPTRTIAFLEGRYAAPFNGFICGPEQDPDYAVWGGFGNRAPEWGHGLPEKCRHLLDVLMPGASVHPLRQRFDRRRFFFSGTPYGDFDQVPIEASADYLGRYRLLLHLGWNTLVAEDYARLKTFVEQGGVLFCGLPQFSRHAGRGFLSAMEDLALWRDGDLSDLCGARIRGAGGEFSGEWNAADRAGFPEPKLSRLPSHAPGEDGPCRLAEVEAAGCEVVAWDACDGRPLVLRNRVGKGEVYLLCAWTYPGHERLSGVASAWVAHLAERHRDDWRVEDPSREVFWNCWREGDGYGKMMLLNTDWTVPGNARTVDVRAPAGVSRIRVMERRPKILTVLPMATLEPDAALHLEVASCDPETAVIDVHGDRPATIRVHRGAQRRTLRVSFDRTTCRRITVDVRGAAATP